MTDQVQDRQTEVGIKLNNVLTFLILAVMTWVGVNITEMRESLGLLNTQDAVTKNEIRHIHESIAKHAVECDKRWTALEKKASKNSH